MRLGKASGFLPLDPHPTASESHVEMVVDRRGDLLIATTGY
jgi:hypothetical protein